MRLASRRGRGGGRLTPADDVIENGDTRADLVRAARVSGREVDLPSGTIELPQQTSGVPLRSGVALPARLVADVAQVLLE